jgi:hypothetical protein
LRFDACFVVLAAQFDEYTYTSQVVDGLEVLEFIPPAAAVDGLLKPIQPPFLVDYYGAVETCKYFLEQAFDRHAALAPHFVVSGLLKSGRSTVVNYLFPAVVRQHYPDALFLRYQMPKVISNSHSISYTLCK